MFDKEAIVQLQESSAAAYLSGSIHSAVTDCEDPLPVAIPGNFALADVEKMVAPYRATRRRLSGCLKTPNEAHFIAYCRANKQPGAMVSVDAQDMSAEALLNFGTTEAPGHADNRAKLVYHQTASFQSLLRVNKRDLSQRELAEWMEDNTGELECFAETGAIATGHAIAAVRNIDIDAIAKVESSVEQLSESRTAFENVKASSKSPLPVRIYLTCEPYIGLPPRTFVCRVSIATGEKAPRLRLSIINLEQHQQEMAQEAVDQITEALGNDMPVYIGCYAKG